jgi:hypothetical protein
MAVIKTIQKDQVLPRVVPLTALNLYLERVRSVTDGVRMQTAGFEYTPLQFGGTKGQQQSLAANSVIKLIDFKVNG